MSLPREVFVVAECSIAQYRRESTYGHLGSQDPLSCDVAPKGLGVNSKQFRIPAVLFLYGSSASVTHLICLERKYFAHFLSVGIVFGEHTAEQVVIRTVLFWGAFRSTASCFGDSTHRSRNKIDFRLVLSDKFMLPCWLVRWLVLKIEAIA